MTEPNAAALGASPGRSEVIEGNDANLNTTGRRKPKCERCDRPRRGFSPYAELCFDHAICVMAWREDAKAKQASYYARFEMHQHPRLMLVWSADFAERHRCAWERLADLAEAA